MLKLKQKFVLWLMSTSAYKFALKNIIPYIRFSVYYTSLRGDKYHAGYNLLLPGDIICTTDNKKLTSLLIPGVFSHAALCVSKGTKLGISSIGLQPIGVIQTPFEIVEMTHTDYTKSHFFDICKEADRVAIFRCYQWSPAETEAVIKAALSLEGAKYDSSFSLGVEALYCSELIYQADKIATGGTLAVNLDDFAGIGRKYLSPDGLASALNVKCVYDSAGVMTSKYGVDIDQLLFNKKL
jgi:hypothetical protein